MYTTLTSAVLCAAVNAQQLMPELIQKNELAMELLADWKQLTSTGKLLATMASPLAYPGDDCCAFYSGQNYTGDQSRVCLVEEPSAYGELTQGQQNSYWCGKNVAFNFGTMNGATMIVYQSGAGNIRNSHVQTGNTHYELASYDVAKQGAATVFDGEDCTGNSARFNGGVDEYTESYYNHVKMAERGVGQDSIRSIMVPHEYSLSLYEQVGFIGTPFIFSGDFWKNELTQEMYCVNLKAEAKEGEEAPKDIYAKTNSLSFVNSSSQVALGMWVPVATQTEDLEFNFSLGWSSTHKDSTEEVTAEKETKEQIKRGMGMFRKRTQKTKRVKNEKFHSLKTTAEDSMTKSTSVVYTIGCSGDKDIGEDRFGVGLWQWVTTDQTGKGRIMTPITVCRYGALFATSPDCPPSACKNGDCSICEGDNYETDPTDIPWWVEDPVVE